MALPAIASQTGPTVLPDVGTLRYGAVTFSALYKSEVSGNPVEDNAKRTTKFMEWTLTVDGTVTLPDGVPNTDTAWFLLRRELSKHGGALTYRGNGFAGLVVNAPGGLTDVAFGPVPKIIFFQPLGQGRSAMIRWQVVARVSEIANSQVWATLGRGQANLSTPVLQYNFENSISYDAQGYASISIHGTLEIPLNRISVDSRLIQRTVDDFRQAYLDIAIDLTKYTVTRRNFNYSRDKRTCEFEFHAEELAPMGLPVGCTDARGTMTVQQIGKGKTSYFVGVRWGVTLRASYVVALNYPRRTAAEAFYALLWFRMHAGANGTQLPMNAPANPPQQAPTALEVFTIFTKLGLGGIPFVGPVATQSAAADIASAFNRWFTAAQPKAPPQITWNGYPTDFRFEEGLYADSKVMTFEASWALLVRWQDIMIATGVWRTLGVETGAPPTALVGGNPWATSVRNIMGWKSWQEAPIDPDQDVIVDLGGP